MVHHMQWQFRFLGSIHRMCILRGFLSRDQEVDVFAVPGLIKKLAKTEDRVAAASHLVDVWVVLDPIHSNVIYTQGSRRLKKRVGYGGREKTSQQPTVQKRMSASSAWNLNQRLRLATHSKFCIAVSNE